VDLRWYATWGQQQNRWPQNLQEMTDLVKAAGYKRYSGDKTTLAHLAGVRADAISRFGRLNKPVFTKAMDHVAKYLPSGLGVWSVEEAIRNLTTVSTSPGECYTGRYATKAEVPIQEVDIVTDLLAGGVPLRNVGLFTRTAFKSVVAKETKSRVICIPPFGMVVQEKRFAGPLTEAMAERCMVNDNPFGTGFAWFTSHPVILLAKFQHRNPLSLDFSKFDITVQPYMICEAMRVVKKCFNLSGYDSQIFDSLVYEACHPVTTNGHQPGIISGSAFTHILGSLISAAAIAYAYMINDLEPPLSQTYGDDAIVADGDLAMITDTLAEHSPLIISAEKSVYGIEWLGLRREGRVWEPLDPERRMAQLCFPARRDTCVDDVIQRFQCGVIMGGNAHFQTCFLTCCRPTTG